VDGTRPTALDEKRRPLSKEERALVEAHADLLRRVAGSFTFPALPFDDLVQEGVFGLSKSVRTFDPARGIPFSAWAWRLIRHAMLDALEKHQSRVGLEDAVDAVALESEVNVGMPTREPRADYSLEEVTAILENYSELYVRGVATWDPSMRYLRKQGPTAGVTLVSPRLLDIDRALQRLQPKPYHAVELCNIWGLKLREAAPILRVAFTTVRYRQQCGLEAIVNYLNDGSTLVRMIRTELPFKSVFLGGNLSATLGAAEASTGPPWWEPSPS